MRIANEPAAESAAGTHRSTQRPIIEPPKLRSEEEGERPTTWFELFFDLVFAVAVDQVARRLQAPSLDLRGVAEFAGLYAVTWWAWVGFVIYHDRFGTDDLGDRLITMLQIAATLVLAVRMHDAFETGARGFALAYGAFRLILALRYAAAAWFVPKVRRFAAAQAFGFTVAGMLWLISATISERPRLIMWGVAFGIDLATPFLVRGFHLAVPPGSTYLEERFGTFTIVVLGEGFIGLVDAMRDIEWTTSATLTVAFSLCLGFSIWWVYFESLDRAPVLEIKRTGKSTPYKLWLFGHLPLVAGIAASGIAVGLAVADASKPSLTPTHHALLVNATIVTFGAMAILHVSYAMVGGGDASRVSAALKIATVLALAAVGLLTRGRSAPVVLGAIAAVTVSVVVIDLVRHAHARRDARRTRE
jgi:low temperature requirement protein LtrA